MENINEFLMECAKELRPVVEAYENRLTNLGPTAKAVFWKNEIHQNQRYRILLRILDENFEDKERIIHDFGCGYGALYDFMKTNLKMQNTTFIGTDISPAMIKEARRRIIDARATFICYPLAIKATDYTFVSGTYNMKLEKSNQNWEKYVKASLVQLWSKTRKGLAFNMLRDDVRTRYKGLYYVNGLDLLNFCERNLSKNVTLISYPSLPDWIYFVRRN